MPHATPRRARRRIAVVIAGGLSVAVALLGGLAPAAAVAATATNLTISGHVSLGTAARATGQGEVRVDLYEVNADYLAASTTTDSSGNYQISLVALSDWGIRFTYTGPDGFLTTWWTAGGGVTAPYATYGGEATLIALPSSSPTVADITLPLPATISGTALTTAGTVPRSATQIRVTATHLADNQPLYPYYRPDTAFVYLNADGTYSFSGLMPGSYKLTFDGVVGNIDPIYSVSAAGATVADPAADVVQMVGSGQTLTAVDAVMFSVATVTGNVPCPGCSLPSSTYPAMVVYILRQTPAGWVYATSSLSDGTYAIPSLLPGTYRAFAWVNNGPQFGWGLSTFTLSEGQHATADVSIVRPPTTRLSGADRFGTSVAVSQNNLDPAKDFKPGVPVVYIADGLSYPDALSAGPAAAVQQGPLLLVSPTSIPTSVAAELTRLKPQKIVVAGGVASVSDAVLKQLKGYATGGDVVRIAGADRYATSIAIAEYAFPNASTAYLATGVNFPDALSAGGAAAEKHGPVILVKGSASSLDSATRNALTRLQVSNIDVVGGTGSVSAALMSSVQSIPGLTATRLSGIDRYATSRAVDEDAFMAAFFADTPMTPTPFAFLAVGTNFPDALSGGALAGHLGAPLFVIPSNCIPGPVMQDLQDLQIGTVVLLGGGGSLTLPVSSFTECKA